MEHLDQRLRDLEAVADVSEEANALSVGESLRVLSQQMDEFVRKSPDLARLIKNLNNTKVNLHLDAAITIDQESYDAELAVVESHMDQISELAQRLVQLQGVIEGNAHALDIDPTIMSYDHKIYQQFERLRSIELKYNQLLVRSMTLLQNYLKLNDNMNNFYRRCELKVK
ncbi:CYFA0S07e01552g1_1 [Cyberlindnera fabianii]|uniref:CYFA0S07e01552g1_1 n=1 Tax=Cyberlindnera fabianii TaxID=36022 RepID=A0A061B179_CYBFA|nr:CYFA0S07e01552g1_1 [Cyberlindnera fabianii]